MAINDTVWCGSGSGVDKLYLQSGQFASTLKTSQYVGGWDTSPQGVSYDGVNTPWSGGYSLTLYLQSGQFTSTLKTSQYMGVDVEGISNSNGDTPYTGYGSLYLQSGQFTSTLKTSQYVGAADVTGISYDGNTPWSNNSTDKLYLQSGQFASTLKTSQYVGGVNTSLHDISYDGTNTLWIASNVNDKLYLQSGQFTSIVKTSQSVVNSAPRGVESNDVQVRAIKNVPIASAIGLALAQPSPVINYGNAVAPALSLSLAVNSPAIETNTIVIQSDLDTSIKKSTPDSNYGDENTLNIAAWSAIQGRSILRFDFSSFIGGSHVITGATLSLYHESWTQMDGRTVHANRLTQTAWVELEATWNEYNSGNSWSTAGGDFTAIDQASAIVPAINSWMDFNVLGQVQYARDNVGDMLHVILKDSIENGGTFIQSFWYSHRETIETEKRPKLAIVYIIGFLQTAPLPLSLSLPTPAVITNVATPDPDTLAALLSLHAPAVVQNVDLAISAEQTLTLALPAPTIAFPIQTALPSELALTLAQPVPDPDMTPNTVIGSAASLTLAQPAPTIYTPSTMNAAATLPIMTLAATGVSGGIDGITATLPMIALAIRAGLKAAMSLPVMTLSATGTTTHGSALARSLPLMTLSATGTAWGRGVFSRSLPMFELDISMRTGGFHTFAATLPNFTLEGRGVNGGTPGTFTRSMPLLTLSATGYNSENGTFAKSLPLLELEAFLDNYQNRII